jgi:formimidoylglutamate deiminase
VRDDQEPDPRVQEPRCRLAEEVHVHLVAGRRNCLVAREEQEVTSEDHDQAGPGHVVLHEQEDHRGVDHQTVGQGIEDSAEVRFHLPAPRKEPVDLVGDAGDTEDDARRPAVTAIRGQHQRNEDGDQGKPRDRERIRKLLQSRRNGAGRHECGKDTPVAETLSLPGFVDAHSHGFQRALRGRSGGADFWAWRDLMLAEAERQNSELVRREYVQVYRELRAAGYTAVGEFHYLGFDEALAAVDAAEDSGIRIVVLLAAYGRGGLPRFRQESVAEYLRQVEDLRGRGIPVGVAPHSVRACPEDWLEEIGRYATAERLPLHVHADEQPREVEECLAEHGIRPIELLDRTGCLTERTTVVHATHANGAELDLLARAGARICACPTTEADLGDGFMPVDRVCTRGIGICIGSDSNIRIDPLEELRELEGIARRQTGRRNVISTETLLCFGADEGAGSLGLETWDDVKVDLSHPSLRGADDVFGALVAGCGADVFLEV